MTAVASWGFSSSTYRPGAGARSSTVLLGFCSSGDSKLESTDTSAPQTRLVELGRSGAPVVLAYLITQQESPSNPHAQAHPRLLTSLLSSSMPVALGWNDPIESGSLLPTGDRQIARNLITAPLPPDSTI